MIYNVTTLRDDTKAHIEAYSEYGAMLPVFVKFIGKHVGKFDVGTGTQVMPYDSEIPATTVEEAFSMYRECAMKRGKEVQQEITDNITRSRLAGR